jgi:Fe-S-cluster containining protein
MLSKNWSIDPIIKDIHLGKRADVQDHQIKIGNVIFHIPYLSNQSLYLLWQCLWPDCHNCCNRQGRLPLTLDDIIKISKKLGFKSFSKFVKEETYVASWNSDSFSSSENPVISTLTMINLKRKNDENENDNGVPYTCRFLNKSGYCDLHPHKPGVCWLYPFFSWSEYEKEKISIHASFQLTGDCPGFYLSKLVDEKMISCLNDYSKKIYDYTMRINNTVREGYARIDVFG